MDDTASSRVCTAFPPRPPGLLQVARERLRVKHYSLRTERGYLEWVRRFVRFHGGRHPREMGAAEVEAFLSHLATRREVGASTQNQALAAILFLYREVLEVELPWLDGITRAKRPAHLPVVLSHREVERLLAQLSGPYRLMARLLYGTGMRLMECVRLPVKDVDFDRREIVVRAGKGAKDRVTVLPEGVRVELRRQLDKDRLLWERDRGAALPGVELPGALDRKYPGAGKQWGWFWVFPARAPSRDPRSGVSRRHHTHEQALQRAIKRAVRDAGIAKPATTHTLRHSFATHLLQAGQPGLSKNARSEGAETPADSGRTQRGAQQIFERRTRQYVDEPAGSTARRCSQIRVRSRGFMDSPG